MILSTYPKMSDAGQGVGSDEQKLAMLQSMKDADSSPAPLGSVPHQNLFSLPLHAADQALLQQCALDSLTFGGFAATPGQRFQTPDDLLLLGRLQQQQLQQQQQLLLQAGAFSGGLTGFPGIGGAAGFLNTPVAAFGDPASQLRQGHNLPSYDGINPLLGDRNIHRRSESFPMTLHRLLGDLEIAGAGHVASFVAGGDAFSIKNPKVFEEKIIPKYFPRMGSFGSFQRQLNLYDFRRVSQGVHRGAYTHPLFRRELPQLSRQMRRTKIKGVKKTSDDEVKDDHQFVVAENQNEQGDKGEEEVNELPEKANKN
jgi:hypothetical protein